MENRKEDLIMFITEELKSEYPDWVSIQEWAEEGDKIDKLELREQE